MVQTQIQAQWIIWAWVPIGSTHVDTHVCGNGEDTHVRFHRTHGRSTVARMCIIQMHIGRRVCVGWDAICPKRARGTHAQQAIHQVACVQEDPITRIQALQAQRKFSCIHSACQQQMHAPGISGQHVCAPMNPTWTFQFASFFQPTFYSKFHTNFKGFQA